MGKRERVVLPPEVLARFVCLDCGVNVVESGDWYMARPEIWDGLGLGWHDNLCVACLEARLGRRLRPGTCGDVHPAQTLWPTRRSWRIACSSCGPTDCPSARWSS